MMLLANMCNNVSQASKFFSKEVVLQNSKNVSSSIFKIVRLGYLLTMLILSFKYLKTNLKYLNSESAIRGFFLISKFSFSHCIKCDFIIKLLVDNFFGLTGFLFFFNDRYGVSLDIECFLSNMGGKLAFALY